LAADRRHQKYRLGCALANRSMRVWSLEVAR
jgi:hypothetical protein